MVCRVKLKAYHEQSDPRIDAGFKKMDFSTKHWAAFTRRHPSAFSVVNTDFLAAKDHWVRTAFSTCNFSFILRGRGEWRRAGRIWAVEAPCVITQWPGEYVEYGPVTLPEGTWDELYLTYPAETKARFEAVRLLDPDRPVWPILDPAAVRMQARALHELSRAPDPSMMADRVDRVCERLILESWLAPGRRAAPPGGTATVRAIAEELRTRFADPELCPEQVAGERGWSASTFRRRWAEAMPESPGRTLMSHRIQAACRLLVETALPVYEVATRSGFTDEYYFSRRFRLEQGMSPREYRRHYLLRRT